MFADVGIENGYYGVYRYSAKLKTTVFTPHGKAVTLEKIFESIETDDVTWLCSCEYQGKNKVFTIERGKITESAMVSKMAAKGVHVFKSNDVLLKSIYNQEESLEEEDNGGVVNTYHHLGWIKIPAEDSDVDDVWAYRANELLCQGYDEPRGEYRGRYLVEPSGSYEKWRDMVVSDVVGKGAIELLLIAGLSAVVNGLISDYTTGENPIIHVYFRTSRGKSTTGMLICSSACQPFDGVRKCYDKYGIQREHMSLYQSWGATENAIITRQQGNYGVPVVLNEIGKYRGKDITSLIYDLSEGTDKARLNQSLECVMSSDYKTTFISFGEVSLLDICKSKNGGEDIRVLELEEELTESAEQADRIKDVSRNNYGWAAPMLAKYILDNGGVDYVLNIYNAFCDTLLAELTDPLEIRYVKKFTALMLTTATIAKEALDIPFDIASVKDILDKYMSQQKSTEVKATSSYERVIEELRGNINKFYGSGNDKTYGEIWGKVEYPNTPCGNKILTEEYSIRPEKMKAIAKSLGYSNLTAEIRSWKEMGVLDCEEKHNTRKRKIIPSSSNKERVYVLRVLEDINDYYDVNT